MYLGDVGVIGHVVPRAAVLADRLHHRDDQDVALRREPLLQRR
jgi:hypothetical protein